VRRLAALIAAAACAAAAAGCGFGEGEEREGGVRLTVTRDFGRERLAQTERHSVREDDTVMRFLQRNHDVETRFGGRFVQAIDGLAGEGLSGRRDWLFFVNGLEAKEGAADYELSPGDRVQWDYRDWSTTEQVPAIVGAFPEPFLNGIESKRRPTRVECEDDSSRACGMVKERLRGLGVAATGAGLGTTGTENVIRVVVGRWSAVKLVPAIEAIADGPAESGVYARFTEDGAALELLGDDGRVAERAPAGTGLLAATAPSEEEIVWAVTGTDDRGVQRAAEALDEDTLRDAFAVAATPDGPERLPLGDGG
jgi:hypothetical protein